MVSADHVACKSLPTYAIWGSRCNRVVLDSLSGSKASIIHSVKMKNQLNKLADIPTEKDNNVLMLRRDLVVEIILNMKKEYNENLWHPLYKKEYPENEYGENSRPVLVRFKNDILNPQVCLYSFSANKFILDDRDITKSVKEWCEIPGYGYFE